VDIEGIILVYLNAVRDIHYVFEILALLGRFG